MLGMYRQIGWQRARGEGLPIDENGVALPWFSYPALFWLGSVLRGSERIFEFGSGNSTAWFSERSLSVVSVEHDEVWAKRQGSRFNDNVELLYRPCFGSEDWAPADDPYVATLSGYPQGRFDVIVVDGMARNTCMEVVSGYAQASEIVIVDNADRPAYYPGIEALQAAGFGRIDFVGPNIVQGVFSCTSVFARSLPEAIAARSGHPRFWGF
jgi:hypothetical protein